MVSAPTALAAPCAVPTDPLWRSHGAGDGGAGGDRRNPYGGHRRPCEAIVRPPAALKGELGGHYHGRFVATSSPQSLKGMHDLLPPASDRWSDLIARFGAHVGLAGYRLVKTPILEDLAVFARLGEGTDIVTKEMYEFADRDGTRIALRPESTAGVARALIQHHPTMPWRVWYASEHFRHENTQAGRYRQHHQLGAECFGPSDPDVDVELIVALWDFYRSLGLKRIRLELNSIGDPRSRTEYHERLTDFLRACADRLDPDDRKKIDSHPIRVLDSKRPVTIEALAGAPTMLDAMTPEALAHFERVRQGLTAAAVPFVMNARLVRGLDYYTHTVFEVVSEAIDAAQSTIGGGGRYDGLVEAMGGTPTPGFGFGTGIERVLLACDAEGAFSPQARTSDVFVVAFGGDSADVRDLCLELRRSGVMTERAFDGRSGRAQMKLADRSGARIGLILGDDERAGGTVTLRDLRGDVGQVSVARSTIVDEVRKRLL